MSDLGFGKNYDKYYKYEAKKRLIARVTCPLASETACRLNISWEQSYKDTEEFDTAMAYPSRKTGK